MPTPVINPTQTPTVPYTSPETWTETYTDPAKICPQQRREGGSPDISP